MASSLISYAEARVVVDAARSAATEHGVVDQVSIVVTDAAGHVVVFHRADQRWFHGEIATARARSAAALRRDGALTGSLLDSRAHWRSMPDFMAGAISLGPGGVLLRADDRETYHHGLEEEIIGAIGVSGAGSDDLDEAIARTAALRARRR